MKSEVRKAAREKQARLDVYTGNRRFNGGRQDGDDGTELLPGGSGFMMSGNTDTVTSISTWAYPQEAEQPDRLWVGSGDSGVVS